MSRENGKSRLDDWSKKPTSLLQFAGLIVGYLGGDWIVSITKPPDGLWFDVGVIVALVVSVVLVTHVYPPESYGRKNYKYWIGQLGAWLVGLIIGGFLPLMKSFVSSPDFLTRLILVPWVLGVLFVLWVFQQWFKTPAPVKQ